MTGDERLRELEERYEGYQVYDRDGDKIGKVDDLFVDETDREEYIGVKMGLFGLSGTTLIPTEMARINERDRTIEVSESKEHVKEAPTYRDDDEVTQDFEEKIRSHFGLGAGISAESGSYGRYSDTPAGASATGDDVRTGDRTDDSRYAERPMGGAQDVGGREGESRDREDTGRYAERPMGGAQEVGRREDEPLRREDTGRYAERPMGGAQDVGGREGDPLDREDSGRYAERPMGGAQDVGESASGSVGREEDRTREDVGRESAMRREDAGSTTPSGGVPDLETGEPGRATGGRGDLDRGDTGAPSGRIEDEGMVGGSRGAESSPEEIREAAREGAREGMQEALREGAEAPGRSSGAPTGGTDDLDRPRGEEPGTREESSEPIRVRRRTRE